MLWAAAVAICCFVLFGAPAGSAPADAPPEVLVLVSAGQNGIDRVAITYAGAVSEQRARGDLRALLAATKWSASDVVVDSQPLAPGEPRMTSVSFVASTLVPYPGGILPAAPFIEAYKTYRSLVLLFQLQRPYRFGGPTSYQDRYLSVRLQQSPNNYRYDISITDPKFGSLNLPGVPEEKAQENTGGTRKRPPLALALALTIGIAVSVGIAVYLLTSNGTGDARKHRAGPGR